MGKKSFKPLPQTVREKPGQKFKIMFRVASIACGPDRENTVSKGWELMPAASGLTKMLAEILLERFQKGLRGDCFEYAIVPMDQAIP
jgi:hypothetical protein